MLDKDKIFQLVQRLDSTTYYHTLSVRDLAEEYEDATNAGDTLLSEAAFLHDIGKIYITTSILDKPGTLSKIEKQIVDLHSYFGYKMLKELGVDDNICQIVLRHHNAKNPSCIESVPEPRTRKVYDYALMLHTIDSFDALTTDRPYRDKFSVSAALSILEGEGGHSPKMLKYLEKTAQYR